MRSPLFLTALLISGFACSTAPQKPDRAPWTAELRTHWDREAPEQKYAIVQVKDLIRIKTESLRFEVRPNDQKAEILTQPFAPAKSEHWYAFSVYLPEQIPQENTPLTFTEWETTPSTVTERKQSSLRFQYLNHEFFIQLNGMKLNRVTEHFTGHWNDFLVQVKWSEGFDGFLNVWLNHHQIIRYVGKITPQAGQNAFFRFGVNREESNQTYVAYFSEVRHGLTESSVKLNP